MQRQMAVSPHSSLRQRASPWNRVNASEWNEYGAASYEKHPLQSPSLKKSVDEADESITSHSLVTLLTKFPEYSASLLQLMEQEHLKPAVVRHVIYTCPRTFSLQGENVFLKPDISVCTEYLGTEGCGSHSSCEKLHICPKYAAGTCNDEICVFGHSWNTNHNTTVLKLLSLDHLPMAKLHELLKKKIHQNMPKENITVCLAYNIESCNEGNCKELHVCLSYVLETKCSKADCQLNHNILDERSCQVLEASGLSTNEAPRDIMKALLAANPLLHEKLKSIEQKDISVQNENKKVSQTDNKDISDDSSVAQEEPDGKGNEKGMASTSETESKDVSTEESDHQSSLANIDSADNTFTNSLGKREKEGKVNKNDDSDGITAKDEGIALKAIQKRTVWSHYLQGNTLIPEICYYSVESMCKNEASACPRLHATEHFHWQVSEEGNHWLNLRSAQVTALECAFCDVSQDGIDLPRLDPASVDMSVSKLFILMGRDIWHADFKAMTLTNSMDTKTLMIRRLCTENIQGHAIKASTFLWFFLDKNNRWVKYGSVDTTGKRDLISDITSDDIEKAYIQDPSASVSFRNSRFQYILDFKTMVQTNKKTLVSREVQRRPEQHIQDEESALKKDEESEFPSTWDPMQPSERMKLVSLASSSAEFQSVINLLAGQLSTSLVTKIERIQNPFLWRALQNKILEMTTIYGDEAKVGVRQLFHGTGYSVVPSICSENFDWRLHGTNTGQKYGRGTYFSTSAKYSYCYCSADSNGDKHMFVARVAVGAIAAGNATMVRPPINPATNTPFDSTVDSVQNYTIAVKYDKQEYYPEYLLTLL
ncbi:protein mono-ADP-ribosyltransferase PARP12-like isoform X3 [Macrobrachium rosenbergii]